MKSRIPLLAMLAGSLTFLASLYFAWISVTPTSRDDAGLSGLLNLLSAFSWNGWGTFGQAAALAAIALIVLALVAFVRPELVSSLPFAGCAIALATLALVNAADLRTNIIYSSGSDHIAVHLATGAYVGGCAVLIVLLGVGLMSSDEPFETGIATIAAASFLTAGLVAAYVLLTFNAHLYRPSGAGGYQFLNLGSDGTAIMLLLASFGLTFSFDAGRPLRRISTAAVTLVLAVGGFSTYGTHMHWPYEAWLAIGCAAGLLVLALTTSGRPRLSWPTRPHVLALEGAVLLFASFFFNWEKSCPPEARTCLVSNGWAGGLKGGLVAVIVVLLLGFRRLAPELAVAVAIYTAGAGFAATAYGSLSYGAFLGFAGAALLLLAVAMPLGRLSPPRSRIIPIVASLAFVAIPTLAATERFEEFRIWPPWFLTLFEAAAIVVALRLCGRWLAGRAGDAELLILPAVLLALTGFNLGEIQDVFLIHWEGWLALGLSALLVVCGLVERAGGIPEALWRVDRISAAEN